MSCWNLSSLIVVKPNWSKKEFDQDVINIFFLVMMKCWQQMAYPDYSCYKKVDLRLFFLATVPLCTFMCESVCYLFRKVWPWSFVPGKLWFISWSFLITQPTICLGLRSCCSFFVVYNLVFTPTLMWAV